MNNFECISFIFGTSLQMLIKWRCTEESHNPVLGSINSLIECVWDKRSSEKLSELWVYLQFHKYLPLPAKPDKMARRRVTSLNHLKVSQSSSRSSLCVATTSHRTHLSLFADLFAYFKHLPGKLHRWQFRPPNSKFIVCSPESLNLNLNEI